MGADCNTNTHRCDTETARCVIRGESECLDDATSVAADGTRTGCSPFKCFPSTGECSVTCTSQAQCLTGFECSSEGKCVKPFEPSDSSGCACRAAGPSEQPLSGGGLAGLLALAGLAALRRRAQRGLHPRAA